MSVPAFAPYIREADFAARAPWVVAERRLLDYLLVWVQEGHCFFTVEGQGYELKPGDWCLVQPGQRVELRGLTDTRTPFAHFDLFFHPDRARSFATRPGQLDLTSYESLLQPNLGVLGVEIPTIFVAPKANFAERFLAVVGLWQSETILAQIEASNVLGSLFLTLSKKESGPNTLPPSRALSWIPSFLSTYLSENISVEDMARRAHLSPSRFQTVFRRAYHTSPGRYLMELRVRHAGELLETTDWTLARIAALCGFADVHHFAKTFKRQTGKTPGAWRRETFRGL